MTNDIDLVVELSVQHVPAFAKLFPIERFYCPPEEVLHIEIRREMRGHCNIIEHASGFKADIYFPYDDLHQWALSECREIELGEGTLRLAPPEYVIVRKLTYSREGGSEKHLRDIRGMLAVSGESIRIPWVEKWAIRLGVMAEWERARGEGRG
jgi:hypothetical protein